MGIDVGGQVGHESGGHALLMVRCRGPPCSWAIGRPDMGTARQVNRGQEEWKVLPGKGTGVHMLVMVSVRRGASVMSVDAGTHAQGFLILQSQCRDASLRGVYCVGMVSSGRGSIEKSGGRPGRDVDGMMIARGQAVVDGRVCERVNRLWTMVTARGRFRRIARD